MRRSLSRATAVCAACALVFSLGVVAPATAMEKPTARVDVATDAAEPSGAPAGTVPGDEEPRTPAHTDGTPSVEDVDGDRADAERSDDDASRGHGSSASEGSEGGRAETESSAWTYVDRASPDRAHDGAAEQSVGTGRLAWDRVYTRRALFRFPVTLDPGTVVDSAVLRTEVAWSYDCDGASVMQLHRVDPFTTGATWNDQPKARDLLDTREVTGGRAACPVDGGVEFDVTAAYQWALDNGASEVHLRLAERDESGTTGWRRFDVEDAPPSLVVDHGPRDPSPPAADPTEVPTEHGTATTAVPSDDGGTVPDEDAPVPAPTPSTEGSVLPGTTLPRAGGADDARVPGRASAGLRRGGGGRRRSLRGERRDPSTAHGGPRGSRRNTVARARGPPAGTSTEDFPPVHGLRDPVDGARPLTPDADVQSGGGTHRRRPENLGRPVPRAPWWARPGSGRGAESSRRRSHGAMTARGGGTVPCRHEG
ncbi:hypothetical protein DSY14_11600 [Nocardiopsis sp. MG754419]|nr:hypothetical protein [Nocardiopsis sp. MG754419]